MRIAKIVGLIALDSGSNGEFLRLSRLFYGTLYYLNIPLVTSAYKTCILNGFEAETSVYFL